MSSEKPIIYGVLKSDQPIREISRHADNYIEARLVVEHGLTTIVSTNIHGFAEMRIERTDQPGVPVLTFIYDSNTGEYGVQEEPGFQKKG